jgi:hypothetical protein
MRTSSVTVSTFALLAFALASRACGGRDEPSPSDDAGTAQPAPTIPAAPTVSPPPSPLPSQVPPPEPPDGGDAGNGGAEGASGSDGGVTPAPPPSTGCMTNADCAPGLECEIENDHGVTTTACRPHGG